jgi:flagellin
MPSEKETSPEEGATQGKSAVMVINTNISSQQSSQLLADSSARLAKSLTRLSSGSKISSPEDDAAGLGVSLRFDAQINRINATTNNISNAVSYTQTQDGFLKKAQKALDRMSELAVMAQDVTKTTADKGLYDKEYQELGKYIDDIAGKDFNGVSLFAAAAKNVTIDSEAATWAMTNVNLGSATYTGATQGRDLAAANGAVTALTNVKAAIAQLATDRATIGANLTRLNYTNEQLAVQKTNLASANSRIKDVDVAQESTEYARYNILVQSGTAMLAQANQQPQAALRLLG